MMEWLVGWLDDCQGLGGLGSGVGAEHVHGAVEFDAWAWCVCVLDWYVSRRVGMAPGILHAKAWTPTCRPPRFLIVTEP